MGAPGSYYWTGTIKVLNLTDNTYFKLKDESVIGKRYIYLGKQSKTIIGLEFSEVKNSRNCNSGKFGFRNSSSLDYNIACAH